MDKNLKSESKKYLTRQLKNPKQGEKHFEHLIEELGQPIKNYPEWHPILTIPAKSLSSNQLEKLYPGLDHTICFVKGFITCPYGEQTANELVKQVSSTPGLFAYKFKGKLYRDDVYPVIIKSLDIEVMHDGTIENRQVLQWCLTSLINDSYSSDFSETWLALKDHILGFPNKKFSSAFVNHSTGIHLHKILKAMNNSGLYGPGKEWNLDNLSEKQKNKIGTNIVKAAMEKKGSSEFEFGLEGEKCRAKVQDTFGDGSELSLSIEVGEDEGRISAFYYPEKEIIQIHQVLGKELIFRKFL